MARVLVREAIAPAGVDLLRSRFDVDEDTESDLAEIIDRYDAIVVRSATKLTAELIGRAARLRVIENHMSGVTGAGDSKRDRNGTFGKNKNTTNPTRIVGIAHRTAVVIESEKAWMTCERIGSSSARITLGRPCSALTSGTAASASWPTYLGMRVSTRFE